LGDVLNPALVVSLRTAYSKRRT